MAAEFAALGARVALIPHGVDIGRFQSVAPDATNGRVNVLAVGRLVEKKGFPVLVEAAALARRLLAVSIVGDGPMRDALAAQIDAAGVADRVTLAGSMTHSDLPQAYANAHIVAVPSIVSAAGDRDGLPNVVLEAMAMGRPVVASDVGAVAAAVQTDATGILVAPGDAVALAAALDRLASNAGLREHLGAGGRRRVERDYELSACTARLIDHLEAVYV